MYWSVLATANTDQYICDRELTNHGRCAHATPPRDLTAVRPGRLALASAGLYARRQRANRAGRRLRWRDEPCRASREPVGPRADRAPTTAKGALRLRRDLQLPGPRHPGARRGAVPETRPRRRARLPRRLVARHAGPARR